MTNQRTIDTVQEKSRFTPRQKELLEKIIKRNTDLNEVPVDLTMDGYGTKTPSGEPKLTKAESKVYISPDHIHGETESHSISKTYSYHHIQDRTEKVYEVRHGTSLEKTFTNFEEALEDFAEGMGDDYQDDGLRNWTRSRLEDNQTIWVNDQHYSAVVENELIADSFWKVTYEIKGQGEKEIGTSEDRGEARDMAKDWMRKHPNP